MTTSFQNVIADRHEYARQWKARTGRKVIGYFCTWLPEEIVYAAGILPVRILGSHEPQEMAERHISSMYCPLCRDCLAQGLSGKYDYLDGIIGPFSCLHIRQTFASWKTHVPLEYSYYLYVPTIGHHAAAKPFWVKQLIKFKTSLEEWTKKPITEDDLNKSIDVYNTNRRYLRQIYDLRKDDFPPVSGAECMEMVVSSQLSDKAEHNVWLKSAYHEFSTKKERKDPGIRLMILGSENDDTEFVRLIESLGATVVIDDHCTGSRYFWNYVMPKEDRLSAIASRYLNRPACPAKDITQERRRFKHIPKLAKDFRAQGAILIQQKFCDPHEFDIPPIKEILMKELGIPSLHIEMDIVWPMGAYRTRLESFLEMLQPALV